MIFDPNDIKQVTTFDRRYMDIWYKNGTVRLDTYEILDVIGHYMSKQRLNLDKRYGYYRVPKPLIRKIFNLPEGVNNDNKEKDYKKI